MQQRLSDNMGQKAEPVTKKKTRYRVKEGMICKVYLSSDPIENLTKEAKYSYGVVCNVLRDVLQLQPLEGEHKPDIYRELEDVIFTSEYEVSNKRVNTVRFNY